MSHEEETHHELQKEEELRVEVAHGRFVHVTLTDGTAEIFGAEIARGAAVKLPGGKHAIFTWSGASLTLRGTPEHCYAASETPMVTYANVEGVLEKRREKARADPTTFDGPRVALVGPTDVGKSSLSKILCNYAVRKGWHPLFVDLDLGQNGIATPATVGAVPVDRPIDPSEGFAGARDLPLVYFHGDSSPGNNPDLYGHLIDNLATMIDKRDATNADAKASGSVVNTMGWVDGAGYKLLLRALDALKITDVLVVGQERLHTSLPESLALVHRRGEESFVETALVTHGAYTLRLFGARIGDDALPTWLCDYTLDVDAVDKQGRVGFAERLPPAVGKEIYLRTPRQINLESSNAHVFEVECPGATAVALGSDKAWMDLDPDFGDENDPWGVEGRFKATVYIPGRAMGAKNGPLSLYVRREGGQYEEWMRFVAM